jgi:hypothetical protein
MLVPGRIIRKGGKDSEMNKHTEGTRPRCSARPQTLYGRPRRRAGALIAAVAGTSLLAAACGGSSAGADTFKGGAYTQSLGYAKCMRSHGVPEFPAPDGQGNFSNSQIQSIIQQDPHEREAFQACRSLLPNEGTGLTVTQLQAMQQQNLRNAVKAAHCMRAHGIGNFPDPAGSTQGSGINWQPVISADLNLNTPSYEAAFKTCSGARVGGPIPPFLAPGAVPPSGPQPGSGGGS